MNDMDNVKGLTQAIKSLVSVMYPNTVPSEEDFRKIAGQVRQNLQSMVPVSDEQFDHLIEQLLATIAVTVDQGTYIIGKDVHLPWFFSQRAELDMFYWQRYREYLEREKLWNDDLTSNLERVASRILDLLGNPSNPSSWRRRGLVMGDVQSGKTATYTALCNMAADAGYKVIIVLAGMQENLRRQTQDRLDHEFSGLKSAQALVPHGVVKPPDYCGVGRIAYSRRPVAFTSVLYDFRTELLKSNNLSVRNLTEPALFVVKKNKTVLNNLESWLYSNNAGMDGKIDQPLLLIDDEADNASVNTQSEDKDPTAINAAIRSILARFHRSSYVGITATPFANIFIDPDSEDEMLQHDIFPRDFIYLLSPPSNYEGADAIFGSDVDKSPVLVPIDTNEIEQYFPVKHKKGLEVVALPPSLVEALRYFVLVNVIRDLRGDATKHRSMMINVSRFTDVHESIRRLVEIWLSNLKSAVRNYARVDEVSFLKIPQLAELRQTWDNFGLDTIAGASFEDIRKEHLLRAVDPIEVRAVNQSTGAASLNYADYAEKGLRVVAVGGNSLSRGLTLEGLCVSYFYRNSQMYDTLLQMGRWFGYHPKFQDLFKIWMAPQAIDWYGYISSAVNELKGEIARMRRLQMTPNEFGLAVRQDPRSLIVTARNKMKAATIIKRPVSLSGKLVETPRLLADPEILAENRRVFEDFIKRVDEAGCAQPQDKGGYLWSMVPTHLITALLRTFATHRMHFQFQGRAIADYVEQAGLDHWDVYLPEGMVERVVPLTGANGRELLVQPQRRSVEINNDMIMVSGTKVRVGSMGETKIGLSKAQIKRIQKDWAVEHGGNSTAPDSEYLIEDRSPLLVAHVLAPVIKQGDAGGKELPDVLFALGVGIPRDDKGFVMATYVVNKVAYVENYDEEEQDGDDD